MHKGASMGGGLRRDAWKRSAIERLLKISLWKTFYTAVLCVSTFTTSALIGVGIEILPLLDTGSILLMLAFYSTVATVFFHLARAGAAVVAEFIVYFIHAVRRIVTHFDHPRRRQGVVLRALAIRDARGGGSRLVLELSVLLLAVVGIVAIFVAANPSLSWSVATMPSFQGTAIIAILAVAALGIGHLAGHESEETHSFMPYMRKGGNWLLLVSAVLAGNWWIDYLRGPAPSVRIDLQHGGKLVGAIIAPGTEGILVFEHGNPVAIFLPWDEVCEVRAKVSEQTRQHTCT